MREKEGERGKVRESVGEEGIEYLRSQLSSEEGGSIDRERHDNRELIECNHHQAAMHGYLLHGHSHQQCNTCQVKVNQTCR